MRLRTLGSVLAIGLIASIPVPAEAITGDIVDQILYPGGEPPAPVSRPPSPAVPVPTAPAPTPLLPARPTSAAAPEAASVVAPAPPPGPLVLPLPATVAGADILPAAAPRDLADTARQLPVAPSPEARWGGFYGGINLGGAWTEGTTASTCTNSVTNTPSGCTVLNESGPNTAGLIGGGQLGYMAPFRPFDLPTLMLGIETDLQGSGISGNQTIQPPIPLAGFPDCTTCVFSAHQSLDWLGSLRARVGLPVDDMLVYATGGLMFGGARVTQAITFTNSNATYSAAMHQAKAGPALGGGVEFALGGPWSARLEGLYYDLGKMRTVAEPKNGAFVNFNNIKTFVFRGGVIRLAVNFKLGDLGWGF